MLEVLAQGVRKQIASPGLFRDPVSEPIDVRQRDAGASCHLADRVAVQAFRFPIGNLDIHPVFVGGEIQGARRGELILRHFRQDAVDHGLRDRQPVFDVGVQTLFGVRTATGISGDDAAES